MNLYSTIVKRSDLKYSDSEKKTQTESLYQQSPFPPSVIKLSHSVNNVVLVFCDRKMVGTWPIICGRRQQVSHLSVFQSLDPLNIQSSQERTAGGAESRDGYP